MRQGKTVYFLKPVGKPGPIKIGCTCYVKERVSQLAGWSPVPLEILVTIDGDFKLEQNLHDIFFKAHLRHEWFRPIPKLVAGIDALKAGKPIEEAFDLSAREGNLRKRFRRPRVIAPERRLYLSYNQREWRASRKLGKELWLPADVTAAIDRWSRGITPTAEMIARIDAVFADPKAHAVTRAERWPERTAA